MLHGAALQREGCWTLGVGGRFRCWFSLVQVGSGEKGEMEMSGSPCPQLQPCFLYSGNPTCQAALASAAAARSQV